MKYAHLDGSKLLGWYSKDIHESIPSPSIEVSDEVWQRAVNIGANAYVNEQFVVLDLSTQEDKDRLRAFQLRQLLQESDYKVLPDYDKPNEAIKAQRQAWRDELRKLGG